MEQAVIFLFGAINYFAIEILWRGYSHWSMAIAGGVCATIIYILIDKLRTNLFCYSLVGMIVITFVELITGIIINLYFRLNVWDYSQMPFNFMGQICPLYSLFWFLLCIPVVKLFRYFQRE